MEDTSADASVGICTRYLHELQARSANQFRSGSVCSLVHCRLLIRAVCDVSEAACSFMFGI